MADQKAVMVAADLHADWKAQAAKMKLPLGRYVELMVQSARNGVSIVGSTKGADVRVEMKPSVLTIDPAKCTNRLRPGSYCRRCGTTHGKSA